MAKIKGAGLGFNVLLSHREVCVWTSKTVNEFGKYLSAKLGGPWGLVIAKAVIGKKRDIRKKNESSGGKGVKLRFRFLPPHYKGCTSGGKGSSPHHRRESAPLCGTGPSHRSSLPRSTILRRPGVSALLTPRGPRLATPRTAPRQGHPGAFAPASPGPHYVCRISV
jgi:hypothetical protein